LKKIISSLFISFFICKSLFAIETCSRVAIINFQEVLVDSNSTAKGEGLRYYLEKDAEAKKYLDIYQNNTTRKWPNALTGTLGTGMLLAGLLTKDSQNKSIFLSSGVSLLILNFLIAKTIEFTNEKNLNRAIDEYNKRNLPQIFFSPNVSQNLNNQTDFHFGLISTWSF
jgi:hypothetical protein